ncbi:MAG TPA: ABC transporter permease [Jiangellales bacterium]|nr:ABC transporter permease [Jiangellales bacterium]
MTATTTAAPPRPSVTKAFRAVLWRDLYVTGRELPTFVAQVVLQPLFLLFVFGRILTQLGYADESYADLLFPGIVALTAVLTGVQGTAFPLVIDFSFTKEIEDRLLAPMPVSLVAVEKILFAAGRSLVAALVMFPVGVWVLGSIPWTPGNWPWVAAFLLLGCLLGAAMGLTLGTLVPANRINVVFALVLTPLLFTGCSQYPWPSLESLRWFQLVTALNPMTYVSEGLRGAMTPEVPHIDAWVCLLVLVGAVGLFGWLGIRGFRRRAID